MIPIKSYRDKEFIESYVNHVIDLMNKVRPSYMAEILESVKDLCGQNFFKSSNAFEELLLMPYSRLKFMAGKMDASHNTTSYVKKCLLVNSKGKLSPNTYYKDYHDAYDKLIGRTIKGMKLNVCLVKETGLRACPYCNRDYITYRHEEAAGAQLDHFYPRSIYPLLALSLYNLVPSCSDCNRVKSSTTKALKSPFDESFDFDEHVTFSYDLDKDNKVTVSIDGQEGVNENLKTMRIGDAYHAHDIDVRTLLDKEVTYSKTRRKEMVKTLKKINVTKDALKESIFGKRLEPEDYGTEPLAKMKSDILKELKVYRK